MWRFIMDSTTCLPRSVNPRVLQCGAGGYAGSVPLWTPMVPSRLLIAALPWGVNVSIVLSCSDPVQVRALQYEPALSLLPELMSAPTGPESKRTPVSGLSNLLSNSDE